MHRTLSRITELAISLVLIALTGCTTMHHGTSSSTCSRRRRRVGDDVVGTGEAKQRRTSPARIGIEVRDGSAEAATHQANERMAAVIAAIKGAGVADADVRTHDFSISFERD